MVWQQVTIGGGVWAGPGVCCAGVEGATCGAGTVSLQLLELGCCSCELAQRGMGAVNRSCGAAGIAGDVMCGVAHPCGSVAVMGVQALAW
jgi:hypothetical protein